MNLITNLRDALKQAQDDGFVFVSPNHGSCKERAIPIDTAISNIRYKHQRNMMWHYDEQCGLITAATLHASLKLWAK